MRRIWPIYSLLFLMGTAYMLFGYNRSINYLDEGFVVHSMIRVLNGELPYRDFFTLLLPGQYYLGAVWMMLFGKSFISIRVLTAITGALVPLIVFSLVQKMTNRYYYSVSAWLISLFFGLSLYSLTPSYSWNATLLGLLSLMFLMKYIDDGIYKYAFITNFLLATSFFFKQTIGLYFLLTFVIILGLFTYRKWLSTQHLRAFANNFVLSFLVLYIPILSYFLFNNALHDLFVDTIAYPLTEFDSVKILPPTLINLKSILFDFKIANLSPILFYFQVLTLAVSILVIYYDNKNNRTHKWFFSIFLAACFLFLHNFERFSFLKVRTVLPCFVVLFVFLLFRLVSVSGKFEKYIKSVLMILLIGSLSVSIVLRYQYFKPFTSALPFDSDLKTSKTESEKYERLKGEVLRLIPEQEKILIFPLNPALYVFLNRDNPTRYDLIIPGNFNETSEHEMIANLKQKDVKYLIYDEYWDFDGMKFRDYAPLLSSFINREYTVVSTIDKQAKTAVLVRNDLL